jgi:hypothetical protein
MDHRTKISLEEKVLLMKKYLPREADEGRHEAAHVHRWLHGETADPGCRSNLDLRLIQCERTVASLILFHCLLDG